MVLALVGWLCLMGGAFAQTPGSTPVTFPALTGRVVDSAGMLSEGDRASLTASLADLEARTTDQLVVVTLPSLRGRPIEEYGYQLGRHWGIGQKDRDSGVLLLVAATEHTVRIEVGYGLEGILTDAATKLIIENSILPAFKAGDFPGGIRNGTNQIVQLLLANRAASGTNAAPAAKPLASTPVWPLILAGAFGVCLMIFCALRGGAACRAITQILFLVAFSGRGSSSGNQSSPFAGGGGSFGGGGSSGSW